MNKMSIFILQLYRYQKHVLPISGKYSHFIPPEHIKKTFSLLVFSGGRGYKMEILFRNGLNTAFMKNFIKFPKKQLWLDPFLIQSRDFDQQLF